MLFVYFKIFRVASERERLIREGMGTCRLSRRVEKTQMKGRKRSATTNYTHRYLNYLYFCVINLRIGKRKLIKNR